MISPWSLPTRARRAALAGVAALSLLTIAPAPASAQWAVYDASNFSQNVLTAARTLTQINNQIIALDNQAQMLINEARNLESLPFSALAPILASIQRTQSLLAQAQGLAYNVGNIQAAFQRSYPQSYPVSTPSAQLAADAQTRWNNALSAYQDSLKTQATVVGNLDSTRAQITALIASSQGSAGALQASLAGNQLMALETQQLADLTALLAAQGRAASLAAAKDAGDAAQGRAQAQRFLAPGSGYQPSLITMFH